MIETPPSRIQAHEEQLRRIREEKEGKQPEERALTRGQV